MDKYENSLNINNVSDLTDFIYSESSKMTTKLRAKHSSAKFVEFTEKTIEKYIKLFDKPLYRKTKRELILQEAIQTMPHGLLWKLFHWDLWVKIKNMEKNVDPKPQAEAEPQEEPQAMCLVPEVIKPQALSPIDNADY